MRLEIRTLKDSLPATSHPPVLTDVRRGLNINATEAMRGGDDGAAGGASISDICSEAKISPGHLYHYFASKEAIVSAMAEARITQVGARFEHVMESSDPIGAFHERCVRCWPLSSGKRRKAGRSIAASTPILPERFCSASLMERRR